MDSSHRHHGETSEALQAVGVTSAQPVVPLGSPLSSPQLTPPSTPAPLPQPHRPTPSSGQDCGPGSSSFVQPPPKSGAQPQATSSSWYLTHGNHTGASPTWMPSILIQCLDSYSATRPAHSSSAMSSPAASHWVLDQG